MFHHVAIYFILAAVIMVISHIFLKKTYTLMEVAAQAGATLLAIIIVVFASHAFSVGDYKVVHGVVDSKEIVQKSCRWTWQSYKDSWCEHHWTKQVSKQVKRDGKYVTEYETYYKPKYPWERKYYVSTTIGKYRISDIDEQGRQTPPRYTIVNKNDPASKYDRYNNYVGAASSSLFKFSDDAYPDFKVKRTEVYDYYNIDQIYFDGIEPPTSVKDMNRQIAILNSKLTNGANVVFYVTDKPESMATSLQVKWNGFQINDVVVVLGVDKDTNKYQYVKVFSWSESSMLDVELRDMLLGSSYDKLYTDFTKVLDIVSNKFEEPNPEKYKYLMAQIGLPLYGHILLILIIAVVTPFVTFFLAKD